MTVEVFADIWCPYAHVGIRRFVQQRLATARNNLVNDAYARGLRIGERASLAVRDALFERGADISDRAVLDSLRADLALGPADPDARWHVLADWAEGRRRGVVGSPHFFVGDDSFFCPALQIDRADGRRLVRMDPRRFDDFFARCATAA